MIERTIEHWRSLPQLKIWEAAEIAGCCEQKIEAALDQMVVRKIGRVRYVTTESFRRWLGEDIPAQAEVVVLDRKAKLWAKRAALELP